MKVKYILITFLSALLIISIAQIFPIFPFAGDISNLYRSGYFNELEKEFEVVKDSFLSIKMMSKPVYAWIFIQDITRRHKFNIKVYNNKGFEVPAPGELNKGDDPAVYRLINSINPRSITRIEKGQYYIAIPLVNTRQCGFCHVSRYGKDIIGVMTFQRDYDAHIYYSSERIIIFILLSLILSALMFLVIWWDPEKKIKELFDKK